MPKTIVKLNRKSTKDVRKKIKFFYTEKYFNKWMNKLDFEGLNYQQKHWQMKKFWAEGTIAVSSIKSADKGLAGLIINGLIDMQEKEILLTPWTFAQRYNIYDFPTHIRLINTRAVKFITTDELELDKEAVIIYAQKNHKSIYSSIEAKLDELVDIEMKKRVARKAQSQPWMYTFSPEDKENAKILQEQMENDEPYLFAPFNNPDRVKGITSGAPYIVDKFEQDRQKIDNEILTMLGFNNVGVSEKKEHLVVDEINANNQEIEEQGHSFKSEIEEGWDRANKVLGFNVKVIDQSAEFMDNSFEQEDEEDEED